MSQMEDSYEKVMFGHDEPDVMWMNGKNLKLFDPAIAVDSEGQKIVEDALYCITKNGIYLCP